METDGGHREEVDGDQLREVILQERAPGLRGGQSMGVDVLVLETGALRRVAGI